MKKILFVLLALAVIVFNLKAGRALDVEKYVPEKTQNALIVIHGFGQDGKHMAAMGEQLKSFLPYTAFYFPTAPQAAPHHGFQWFDIPVWGLEAYDMKTYEIMLSGAVENIAGLHKLIEAVHNEEGIPYRNINVAGFSQGGLMAVLSVLTYPSQLGKAVSFSGVPFIVTPKFDKSSAVAKPDILLIQGDADKVVPTDAPEMTKKSLESFGITPKVEHIRGMGHQISNEALQKMLDFLRQ